ncbi:hypothetical protein AYI68_g8250 [Smittium mucronatum]|uniref:CHY-type domain-containing protein n=1 Tax=Smittium mucronatum TaxID=133383 RepID=A0A1R0GLE2_9FUNG|nr:hypothetical protein AYI68_g8250 [Smittium mucronatum]
MVSLDSSPKPITIPLKNQLPEPDIPTQVQNHTLYTQNLSDNIPAAKNKRVPRSRKFDRVKDYSNSQDSINSTVKSSRPSRRSHNSSEDTSETKKIPLKNKAPNNNSNPISLSSADKPLQSTFKSHINGDKRRTTKISTSFASKGSKPSINPRIPSKVTTEQKNKLIRQSHVQELLKSSNWTSKIIEINDEEMALAVALKPFDDDFPYEIEELRFALVISNNYPAVLENKSPVEIHVSNSDIPVGIKTNLESKFEDFVLKSYSENPDNSPTISSLLEWLGKNLESIFNLKPASTLKFVSFQSNEAQLINNDSAQDLSPSLRMPVQKPLAKTLKHSQNLSNIQKLELSRNIEIGQLEKRFPSSFILSRDGASSIVKLNLELSDTSINVDLFSIPLELKIPDVYPSFKLHPSRAEPNLLNGVPSIKIKADSIQSKTGKRSSWAVNNLESFKNLEATFQLNAITSQATLLGLINWLDINFMELLNDKHNSSDQVLTDDKKSETINPSDSLESTKNSQIWPQRKGIELKFGVVELDEIQLMTCKLLKLVIKCNKCKNNFDFDLNPTTSSDKDNQASKSCPNCGEVVDMRLRSGWIHQNSRSLGFLDTRNGIPVDLRPSNYNLVCDVCSNEKNDLDKSNLLEPQNYTNKNIFEIACGTKNQVNCRICHSKMSIYISDVSFVKLVPGLQLGTTKLTKTSKKPTKSSVPLGFALGSPLPQKGACKHYIKSFRWFRFPCCFNMYPCDTCHDIKESHEHVLAKSMICGFCSKEQNISKAELSGKCVNCGNSFYRKTSVASGAYWEGGNGVRDKSKLSKNDPRKYKGLGKTVSNKRSSK